MSCAFFIFNSFWFIGDLSSLEGPWGHSVKNKSLEYSLRCKPPALALGFLFKAPPKGGVRCHVSPRRHIQREVCTPRALPAFHVSILSSQRAPCITLGDTQRSWRKLRCALAGIVLAGASVSPCEGNEDTPPDPAPITRGALRSSPCARCPPATAARLRRDTSAAAPTGIRAGFGD